MAAQTPNLIDIALQLETATAQLRVLSALPESQLQRDVKQTVTTLSDKVENIGEQLKKVESDLQSLRDTTNNELKRLEVFATNNLARIQNKNIPTRHALKELLNIKTGKRIPGFPKTAQDIINLNGEQLHAICLALGWDVTNFHLREKKTYLLTLLGYEQTALYFM